MATANYESKFNEKWSPQIFFQDEGAAGRTWAVTLIRAEGCRATIYRGRNVSIHIFKMLVGAQLENFPYQYADQGMARPSEVSTFPLFNDVMRIIWLITDKFRCWWIRTWTSLFWQNTRIGDKVQNGKFFESSLMDSKFKALNTVFTTKQNDSTQTTRPLKQPWGEPGPWEISSWVKMDTQIVLMDEVITQYLLRASVYSTYFNFILFPN
jgi:hypothetical protein